MPQENVFKKNKFSSTNIIDKKNKFDRKLFDDQKEIIDIDEALKSVNLPEHFFTNFFKGRKDPMFKFVKTQYAYIKSDKFKILENYELKDVVYKDNLSEEKIIDIVKCTFDKDVNLNTIYRFKNYENPAFQLYVNKESNNNYKVIIIDLYHLVIPAADRGKGRKKADIENDYNEKKLNDYCLSNIIK